MGTGRRPTPIFPIIFWIWAATVCLLSLNIRKELPRLTATRDPAAAAAVASVDAPRLRSVENLYRRMGLGAEDAQARAILFYSFIFGQSLLFIEEAPQ